MYLHQETKTGELLRSKDTQEVYLVVDKTKQGLQVVNLNIRMNPIPVMMILPANADRWVRDVEIDDLEEWEKKMLEEKLQQFDLIDD